MPELPDVELFKRHLDATSLHRPIERVAVADRRILAVPASALSALAGAAFAGSRRHGKHLLVRLDRGGWLTLHFGMTGSLQFFEDPAPDPAYDRVRFDFAGGAHLAYVNRRMLGRVGLAADADAFIRGEGLGPDALDPRLDAAAFKAALGRGKRSVKAALMDQAAVAGIGNIYSDEILFQARLHPATRLEELDEASLDLVYRQVREVLTTAIACGAASEELLDRLPAGYILPQRRKDGRCPRCKTPLASLKTGGRTAWLCPACQRVSR